MKFPVITVIVPVFNEEQYIERCIRSIVNQTYENIELILVDGGSTDSSPSICDAWGDKWNSERVLFLNSMGTNSETLHMCKVIHMENRGVSATRNEGIRSMHGDYVVFVDGDDYLASDAISLMYEAMNENETDMVGCLFDSVYIGDSEVATQESNELKIKSEINNQLATHFVFNNILNGDVHCWGRLFKRDILNGVWFKEGLTIGEDMIFLIEYVKKCRVVSSIDYVGYHYFRNPGGAMWRKFTPAAMDQITCYKKVEKLIGPSDRLKANMLIAIMLTAGRIAVLDAAEWEDNKKYIDELATELSIVKTKEAFKLLDKGYKVKVWLFSLNPMLYIKLYHRSKR